MIIKLKRQAVLDLWNGLQGVGNLTGVKIAYAVGKNIEKVKQEVEVIGKTIQPSKEFMEYDQKRVALAQKHAKKDDKGQPIVAGGQYIMEDRAAFDKDFETLKEENKTVVESREKQQTDYITLLDEEVELDLHTVKLSDVPETITVQQMSKISVIINEGTE